MIVRGKDKRIYETVGKPIIGSWTGLPYYETTSGHVIYEDDIEKILSH